ncbi:hypothetical protein V3F56_06240 [Moorellaceae bacterium AZ2]
MLNVLIDQNPDRVVWYIEASRLRDLMQQYLNQEFGIDVPLVLDRDEEYPEECGTWIDGELCQEDAERLLGAGLDLDYSNEAFDWLLTKLCGTEEVFWCALDPIGDCREWIVRIEIPFEAWAKRRV